MNSRREVSQLVAGDQVRTQLTLQWEVVVAEAADNEFIKLVVRPAPCGPECGKTCDCHSAMFGDTGPFTLHLKASQRLAFLGNLKQLQADLERTQAHIARLQTSNVGNASGMESATQRSVSHKTT